MLLMTVLVAALSTAPPIAPLPTPTFEALDLYRVPSLRMSAGWSACITLVVGEDRLMRIWYRRADGLVVATLHDTAGHVITQTHRGWLFGRNLEQFGAVLSSRIDRAYPPTTADRVLERLDTRVNLSAYDPATGEFIEGLFVWSARLP